MPKLDYDPSNPTDLLGRPLCVGDVVAWATTWGRSPAQEIGTIEKVKFIMPNPHGSTPVNVECSPAQAKEVRIKIRPIASTRGLDYVNKITGETIWGSSRRMDEVTAHPDDWQTKLGSDIQLIRNIVKLEKP